MRRGFEALFYGLLLVTTAVMALALWLIFVNAPEEKVMGAVQKLFYFHVRSRR
jgi:heme exporter protein C